ncbi:MAG: AAA family ATPase [Nanoarchaeota archaeon]|nr:AAA family ATPase [Nanoarchaeota archaeon]MBU1644132.1 AAA family ATPase [Nanoarchaeota archaeon]MBU1977364.1 AAA family ATPase [Nanoarchaeota archaeon]
MKKVKKKSKVVKAKALKKQVKVLKKQVKKSVKSKIVPRRTQRIKSGIPGLDPLTQGGLKEGSITLVIGTAGSGKTIFAMQFLMEGLKNGESCLYLTFEEKKEKLYSDVSAFGWDFKKYEEAKKFFAVEYNPEQVKSLIEEGGGTVDQLISKNKITRLVIDSITSFSLLYQDELSRKEAGLALFELMNKWGCTVLLTGQAVFKQQEFEETSLEFEADNIILLYHSKKAGKRIRALEILKMRGTKHVNKTMAFDITKTGLVVKPGTIVKNGF